VVFFNILVPWAAQFFFSQRTTNGGLIKPGCIPLRYSDIENVFETDWFLLVWKGIGKPSEKEITKEITRNQ
jgi:hypothetical protein